jgi:hypothetical protein
MVCLHGFNTGATLDVGPMGMTKVTICYGGIDRASQNQYF